MANSEKLPGAMPDRLPETARAPADFDPPMLAKTLLRATRAGTLGTLDRNTGHPFASLVNVATDVDGAPVILADMGDGSGQVAHEWFDTMYEDVAEQGIGFTAIGIVTSDPASVESVLSWAARLQGPGRLSDRGERGCPARGFGVLAGERARPPVPRDVRAGRY